MCNALVTIAIEFSLFLGCKVTTLFRKLYQLPMEKAQMRQNRKLLQINKLRKCACYSLWKNVYEGMERRAKRLTETVSSTIKTSAVRLMRTAVFMSSVVRGRSLVPM